MRSVVLIVSAAVLLSWAEPGLADRVQTKEQAVARELGKLQGAWKGISYESKSGKNENAPAVLLIVKNAFYYGIGHGTVEGDIVVDPTATPKTLDLQFTDKDKQVVWRFIYHLDRDELQLCSTDTDLTKRPSSFPTKKGWKDDLGVFVFKRVMRK